MSWDDEDFEVPAAADSWEDGVDDGPILESWDIDEEEEERKKKEAEAKKKAEREALNKKQSEAKAAKARAKNGEKVLLEIDTVDERTRADMLRKAQESSDMKNATDLFGDLTVGVDVNEHPRERAARLAAVKQDSAPKLTKDSPLDVHPLFKPETKQDYEKLRKALSAALTKLADESSLNYASSLAIDLIRDVAKPLSVENIRKVNSTLNVVLKDKERAERAERLKKAGGTATGGAGKKKAKPAGKPQPNQSFKKDVMDDIDGYDDFGDDDFM